MTTQCDVPTTDHLPPAHRRAADLRADLGMAVGLYACGDRSEIVLRTLARGKVAYDAVGARFPAPVGVSPGDWRRILARLVRRYDERPYTETVSVDECVAPSGYRDFVDRPAPARPAM